MKFLALDIESGGIGTDKTLLEAFFLVLDKSWVELDRLHLLVKPDNGIYNVEARALEVNKIDLVKHNQVAITYKQAGTKLYEFLSKNQCIEKLVPLGHGVAFDCRFLQATLISPGSWDKFVSHQCQDTCSIARFLMYCHKIPEGGCNLEELTEKLITKGSAAAEPFHTAKGDTTASVELFKYFASITC